MAMRVTRRRSNPGRHLASLPVTTFVTRSTRISRIRADPRVFYARRIRRGSWTCKFIYRRSYDAVFQKVNSKERNQKLKENNRCFCFDVSHMDLVTVMWCELMRYIPVVAHTQFSRRENVFPAKFRVCVRFPRHRELLSDGKIKIYSAAYLVHVSGWSWMDRRWISRIKDSHSKHRLAS